MPEFSLPAPPGREAETGVRSEADGESDEERKRPTDGDGTPPETPLPEEHGRRCRRPLPWAQLLMRVFFLDVLTCPRCATAMVVLALISDPPVVGKILRHLGLPDEVPPVAPAAITPLDEPLFEDAAASSPPARPPP
jgi:hypothetical protein